MKVGGVFFRASSDEEPCISANPSLVDSLTEVNRFMKKMNHFQLVGKLPDRSQPLWMEDLANSRPNKGFATSSQAKTGLRIEDAADAPFVKPKSKSIKKTTIGGQE
jgi:hypothetical protein